MKKFVVPNVEVVRFNQRDVIVTSTCVCVDCPSPCPEGSNDCKCVDFPQWTNQ